MPRSEMTEREDVSAAQAVAFGVRLRDARKAKGYSQELLGSLVGVGKASVSSWEKGRDCPTFRSLALLSEALGASLDRLMLGNDSGTIEARKNRDGSDSASSELEPTAPARKARSPKGLNLRLKAARRLAGLSQAALAERTCVSRGAIAQWEMGVTSPSLENLLQVATVLGVSLDYLALGRGTPESTYSLPVSNDANVVKLAALFENLPRPVRAKVVDLIRALAAFR
jgi:transcriptional regulator with XRE-family HTH domain